MHMPEGDPHPSILPGFRGTRDPEHSVTRSRSGRKKKRVEFEDVQPQDIPNPTEDNFPRRCITQLPDGVSHIYYTGNELTDIATIPAVRDAVVNIFGQFMEIRLGNSDNRLIQALTERCHIKSGNVSIAHLMTYLTVAADREDDITIVRAFIFFMMGHLWFQTANDTVPLGYLAAVNDLDSAAQYDWGFAILASMYHGLDTAVTTGGVITGFVQLLPYWFYEYCGVGHPVVKEEVKYPAYPRLRAWERGNRRKTNDQAPNLLIIGRYHIDHRTVETITWEPWFDSAVSETEDLLNAKLLSSKRMSLQVTGDVHIPLDTPLSMSPHISPAALDEMRHAGFVDCEQFVVGEERETYASYWAEQTLEVEGPDLGWHMEWTGQREKLPIAHLRDPSPMSSSYGAEELWHLTHGMRRLILVESARDAQRLHEVEDELAIVRRQIDIIDHQIYAYDLQLGRGRDVRVVPLPPGGSARMKQRGSGPRTRGGSTSRRGRGTGDDSE
ncbi:hypothetical protein GIB67_040388 [Kingdonia uniflora]|uniref:Aminotransferase-like plant mobile domain-containing protein n=1 Tax=Kingdonia uniflora TaxID=39325 RepID=A0A7J7KXL9_9MAGN|nr:hypothetical protein GIB67_040388 [Kingdonia uniflora]